MTSMPLNFIGIGKLAEINSVQGGESLRKKIMEMGMSTGAIIKIMKNDNGPLIVKVGETRLVLARGMAQKVMVSEV
ncbi:FeoA domain-containing protein [Clostridium estertheticum]|uniref:FeoA domain-containing protein n=2 Tax=Clostridium TaxID=1485 RepID=A0AA47I739_9CLOT|nr:MULTISPECIES: FeoA domain-containing protein [Clostridium]MBU3097990.1 FeoA domain-containing protein [Clostridium sp. DSM 17811]MCB2353241.1 FeoA domain-containing protein [Clostridium estertheticum]WAG41593.1 FeoA domain-containing protein [Clostridium estertheticum]WAG60069.1 FeoA domain-containing protein [Clostridium estertheticum]WAG65851.1 FeoA domain-containing protein [Clostridium estertheticum]